jgi:hypothetical protein
MVITALTAGKCTFENFQYIFTAQKKLFCIKSVESFCGYFCRCCGSAMHRSVLEKENVRLAAKFLYNV